MTVYFARSTKPEMDTTNEMPNDISNVSNNNREDEDTPIHTDIIDHERDTDF